eukprot:355021-Chlamydomonas_euryale.AAC.15
MEGPAAAGRAAIDTAVAAVATAVAPTAANATGCGPAAAGMPAAATLSQERCYGREQKDGQNSLLRQWRHGARSGERVVQDAYKSTVLLLLGTDLRKPKHTM